MATELEVTLKQLAQMALGVQQLDDTNISVLYSLIDVILKKLNCQHEKVTMDGHTTAAKYLKNSRAADKRTPLAFSNAKVEALSVKLEKLDQLEQQVDELGTKLEQHFEHIREINNAADSKYEWQHWEIYAGLCEDFYPFTPENKLGCTLVQNAHFMTKMRAILSAPLVERMRKLEQTVETIQEQLDQFIERANAILEHLTVLPNCVFGIENLHKNIAQNHDMFLSTMDELQIMLDAKLDHVHMAPFKKCIDDRYDAIHEELKQLLHVLKVCPASAAITWKGPQCLSCNGPTLCAEINAPQQPPVLPQKCSCTDDGTGWHNDTGAPLQERIQHLDIDIIRQHLLDLSDTRRSCRFAD